MGIYEKLQAVQTELKAPKGQYNSFGKYKYRSCEDILEAAKPVLAKNGGVIVISDEVVMIGERYYIKATASFIDPETGLKVDNCAWAREPNEKKGMDESQITGTASSYARKYALNGLLLIDDTKDADTDENHIQQEEARKAEGADSKNAAIAKLVLAINKAGYEPAKLLKMFKLDYNEGDSLERNLARLNEKQLENAIMGVNKSMEESA